MSRRGVVARIMSGLFAGLSVFAGLQVSAQERPDTEVRNEVTGLITDDLGNPLAGAAVIVRGQPVSEGVVTDWTENSA